MQYIRLGDTGLVVSRLAFGSMTFGFAAGPFTSVYKVDQAGADALVARAIDTGINFFNSADVYAGGESERILGKAIGTKRKEVVIATKVGNRMGPSLVETGLSRRHILEAVNGSLTRLGTDYIDVYLVHKVDAITPVEETIEALEDAVRQGKVRYVGFSNWPLDGSQGRGHPACARMEPVSRRRDVLLPAGRDLEHEFVPLCTDAGIGVMVWSPLAGGFLSGKYSRSKPKGESVRSSVGVRLPPLRSRARVRSDRRVAIDWDKTRRITSAGLVGLAAHATGGVVDPRRRIERRAVGREPQGDGREARCRRSHRARRGDKASRSVSALVQRTCRGRQGLRSARHPAGGAAGALTTILVGATAIRVGAILTLSVRSRCVSVPVGLLCSQRDERIDPRGAPRRRGTCQQSTRQSA